jgi:hypothetical protein
LFTTSIKIYHEQQILLAESVFKSVGYDEMRKLLAAIIILCVFAGNSISADAFEPAVAIPVPVIDAPVFSVVSDLLMPCAVMGKLINGDIPLRSQWEPSPVSRDRQALPKDAWCSGAACYKKVRAMSRYGAGRAGLARDRFLYFQADAPQVHPVFLPRERAHRCIGLFLREYLAVLAKSNLPWQMVQGYASIHARSLNTGPGFFFIYGGRSL